MIDYQKLKIAHELAGNCTNYTCVTCDARFNAADNISDNLDNEYNYRLYAYVKAGADETCIDEYFDDIDDLIEKLKELTKSEEPKSKYKVGDEAWFINDADAICSARISRITVSKAFEASLLETCYFDRDGCLLGAEHEIYPTKIALIEAQIELWTSLKNQEKSTDSNNVSMQENCRHRIYDASCSTYRI